MELIDNKALRISVPHELAREIQQRIFKVEVLEFVFEIIAFVFTPLPLECEVKEPLCPVVWLLLS